ncbi:MAG: hypothetical protein GWN00_04830, partial [Aliifodinibius sp.]|nr:hypothetical protein [Fodinibius sp.]NIV10537.1 hypothetical protein [Fodinibius sp.]NIY24152.1 hypothetical protein [Fodinibius sp.]
MGLIGTSYYGALVARYAMLHAEHVSKLVMVGALYPTHDPYYDYQSTLYAERIDTAAQSKFIRMKEAGENKTNPIEYCEVFWKAYGA